VEDDYPGSDFYCDVAVPYRERLTIVRETHTVLAFHHTRPKWQLHIVVAPKQHITSLTTVSEADVPVVRELLEVVQEVARIVESSHGAARVVTNVGHYQDSKHLHVHVVSGNPI
jgi:histidine triad (HIT) family protein